MTADHGGASVEFFTLGKSLKGRDIFLKKMSHRGWGRMTFRRNCKGNRSLHLTGKGGENATKGEVLKFGKFEDERFQPTENTSRGKRGPLALERK